jgi:ATP-dependent Clp protease ATP-binding subunit ClpX
MNQPAVRCSFCGAAQSVATPFIAGLDGHICEACVQLAHQVVTNWGRKRALADLHSAPPRPVVIKARLDEYVIGQDLAKEILAVAVYNHYKRLSFEQSENRICSLEADVEVSKSNVLLLGPSGSGKTLLASTLARIVGVPFAVADATTITQAGYVGDDVESILARLLEVADGNVGRAEWGIVYIDEIDKLARSPETASGMRDVSGEGVQQALLKLIEGAKVKVPVKGRRREGGEELTLDTSNILFIVGGAFAGLDKVLEARLAPRSGIGFRARMNDAEQTESTDRLLEAVHPEDLRRFGLIPEFIGRFPVLATLESLDEDAMLKVLTEPRNALVRQYRRLFAYEGVELEFTEDALRAIARQAIERGTGARGLRSVLEVLLRRTMFELPDRRGIDYCIVDEAAVDGSGEIRFESRVGNTPAATERAAATFQ